MTGAGGTARRDGNGGDLAAALMATLRPARAVTAVQAALRHARAVTAVPPVTFTAIALVVDSLLEQGTVFPDDTARLGGLAFARWLQSGDLGVVGADVDLTTLYDRYFAEQAGLTEQADGDGASS